MTLPDHKVNEWKGHIAMLAFSFLVSVSFILGHIVADEIAPSVINAVRFLIASIVLGVVALFFRANLKIPLASVWRYLLLGAFLAIYFITMFEALQRTSAINTSAVFTLSPLLAVLAGYLILGERSSTRILIALLIGAAGAVWVIFRADIDALLRFEIGKGEAIFFMGAIAHAIYPALARRFNQGEQAITRTFWMTIAGLLVLVGYGLPDIVQTDFTVFRPVVWFTIFYLAIFASASTFFLVQFAAQILPPTKVLAYTYLIPAWVVLLDFSFHGTFPSFLILLGVLAAILALTMLIWVPKAEYKA